MENIIPIHFSLPIPIIHPVFIEVPSISHFYPNQVPPISHCYPNSVFNEDVTLRQQGENFGKTLKMISWCPPPDGWAKINTDGAYKSSIDLASAGGVVRDSNGNWRAGFSMNFGKSISPLEAEFIGILGGLELVWKMGFKNVILESDCKVAVDFLLNSGEADSYLLQSIRQLIGKEWNVIIQHQYREGNQAADWMANLGIQLPAGLYEFANPPSGILKHIIKDCAGVKYPRLCSS